MAAITGVVISKTDVVSGQKLYTANYAKMIDDINGFIADVIAKAVDLASAQSITGVKTFTVSPLVPSLPSGATAAVNKTYADSIATGKEDAIVTQATANLFGAWTTDDTVAATLVKDTVYKAQCDGFVTAFIATGHSVVGFTDSSNPPTTERTHNVDGSGGGITVPVRKDDYVKIESSGGTPTLHWLPFGTGGLVAQ